MQIKQQFQRAAIAPAVALLSMISLGNVAFAGPGKLSPHHDNHSNGPSDASTRYRFSTLDVPSLDFGPAANGINDEGLVSGDYSDASGFFHGFLWRDGNEVSIDAPGDWADTYFGGVNDEGVVIGNYDDAQTVSHATLYHPRRQTWSELPDISGLPWSLGLAVNNRGTAVGFAECLTCSSNTCWIWDGHDYSFFVVPDSVGTEFGTFATGINDWDEVVGYYQDSAGTLHGFLKRGANFNNIDFPGAAGTQANGINDKEDVAGWYWTDGPTSGFVKHAGKLETVNYPGADQTEIMSINNRGDIAGIYFIGSVADGTGNWYAFVATSKDCR